MQVLSTLQGYKHWDRVNYYVRIITSDVDPYFCLYFTNCSPPDHGSVENLAYLCLVSMVIT
jgi:hypothetical protein